MNAPNAPRVPSNTMPSGSGVVQFPPDHLVIAKGLRYFLKPGQITEVRFIGITDNSKYPAFNLSGYYSYDHLDALALEVVKWRGKAEGCYFIFNEIDPELLALCANKLERATSKKNDEEDSSRTQDTQILSRRWILIDADPKRMSVTTGNKLPGKVSASDEEKARSEVRIGLVDQYLTDIWGFAGRPLADSGNGYHLWIRIDLPLEDDDLVKSFLEAVNRRFGDELVGIDTSVANLSRVAKIYGSLARKGSNVPTRPHRPARILKPPPEPKVIGREHLEAVIADNPAPPVPQPPPVKVPTYSSRPSSGTAPAKERALKYILCKNEAIEGQEGHKALFGAACVARNQFGLDLADLVEVLGEWNQRKAIPPENDYQVEHKAKDAIKLYPNPSLEKLNEPFVPDPSRNGYASHGMHVNGQAAGGAVPARPAPPPIDLDAIKARARELTQGDVVVLYRDKAFLDDLAKLERADPGEAAGLGCLFSRMKDFKTRDFKAAMQPHRDAAKGGGKKSAEEILGEALSDLGNSRRLLKLHGDKVRFDAERQDWLLFDGTRWRRGQQVAVENLAKDVSGSIGEEIKPGMDDDQLEAIRKFILASQSERAIFACMKLFRSDPMITITSEQLDADPLLFNFRNGTVDLRTGTLRPHDPSDLLTKAVDIDYDPDAKAPRWEQFEKEIFPGEPEKIAYMRRLVGYAMTGLDEVQEINILQGEGSNGKSLYVGIVLRILGAYACTADPKLLIETRNEQHPTGLADLEGKRFVSVSELEDGQKFETPRRTPPWEVPGVTRFGLER